MPSLESTSFLSLFHFLSLPISLPFSPYLASILSLSRLLSLPVLLPFFLYISLPIFLYIASMLSLSCFHSLPISLPFSSCIAFFLSLYRFLYFSILIIFPPNLAFILFLPRRFLPFLYLASFISLY